MDGDSNSSGMDRPRVSHTVSTLELCDIAERCWCKIVVLLFWNLGCILKSQMTGDGTLVISVGVHVVASCSE